MNTSHFLMFAMLPAWLLCTSHPVYAQTYSNEWLISTHTGYSSIDATTQHPTGDGQWWGEHDDNGMNYGLSVTYFTWGNLGIRATYERGSDYRTLNQCPDNTVCPAITISESGNMEHYALVFAPEFDIYRNTVAFISLGAARSDVAAGPLLPSYNETDFIYGIGVGMRLDYGLYLSAEYQTTNTDFETLRVSLGVRF